jgi:hypothetical protein
LVSSPAGITAIGVGTGGAVEGTPQAGVVGEEVTSIADGAVDAVVALGALSLLALGTALVGVLEASLTGRTCVNVGADQAPG